MKPPVSTPPGVTDVTRGVLLWLAETSDVLEMASTTQQNSSAEGCHPQKDAIGIAPP
jgi:hypothetical protein